MKIDAFFLSCLILAIPCTAETITVDDDAPADYSTIQAAIDSSQDGDTVLVSSGIYNETIYFNNRAILLTSSDPNDPNTVNSTQIIKSVYFDFAETPDSIITGFTLEQVVCWASSPTISKNAFDSSGSGPAIKGDYGAAPIVSNNLFDGIDKDAIHGCNGPILGNIITNNVYSKTTTNTSTVTGGVIYNCHGLIQNNLLSDNQFIHELRWNYSSLLNGKDITTNWAAISECHGEIAENQVCRNSVITKITRTNDLSSGDSISYCDLAAHGGGLYDCDGQIRGNLIAENAAICQLQDLVSTRRIDRNTLSSQGAGLYSCDGEVVNNTIEGNSVQCIALYFTALFYKYTSSTDGPALANCLADIADNVITGNTGLRQRNESIDNSYCGALFDCDGRILRNHIHNNGERGVEACDGIISNNIIEGHFNYGLKDCAGDVINNTIMGNRSSAIYNCNNVKNNIIAFNDTGIDRPCNNSYNCFWSNEANFSNSYGKVGDFFVNPEFQTEGHWDFGASPEDSTDDVWISGDYHIKSDIGRWSAGSDSWVLDAVTSPCVDAGDPVDAIGQEINPNGGRINVGTYGGTIYASKSPNGDGPEPVPECVNRPSKDFNNDCKVDLADFAEFLSEWLACGLDIQEACWE